MPRSRICLPAWRLRIRAQGGDERGFGLVESVMSMGIAAAGLLAVAGLMAAGAGLQRNSRDGGRAGMAAMQQLEQLRILPRTDARVQVGGSLTANVANYNTLVDAPPAGRLRVRWQVLAGPAGTVEIRVRTIRVTAGGGPEVAVADGSRQSEVRSLVWRPAIP